MNLIGGMCLIALGVYSIHQHYQEHKTNSWKEATDNGRSDQEATQPARVSGSSDRDNGTGIRDLCAYYA